MKITRRARREAKRLFHLCLVDGLLDEGRVRRVVQDIVLAGRHECPAILSHLGRLVRMDRARHAATIESAVSLPADLQAAIQAGLTRRYGPGLTTAFVQHTALIAGMRIQVGCDVYDGSVRARLATLEGSF